MTIIHFQFLSAILFSLGLYGVLARRSAVLILMSIELMLNAVNINLIGFVAFRGFGQEIQTFGQVLIIFVIVVFR